MKKEQTLKSLSLVIPVDKNGFGKLTLDQLNTQCLVGLSIIFLYCICNKRLIEFIHSGMHVFK